MRNIKIALCYCNTRLIFIDDNSDYLQLVGEFLERENNCVFFNKPLVALSYLNDEYQESNFLERVLSLSNEEDETRNLSLPEIIKNISRERGLEDRFEEISTIIVDYTMPDMNGVELCKSLKSSNIRKILLTGDAGLEIAKDAFNGGHIDKFIEKSDPDIRAKLLDSINEMQKKYFIGLSNTLMEQFNPNVLRCLEDEPVANRFYSYISENKIVEYYIVTHLGDFLLIDKDGNESFISIKAKEDLDQLYESSLVEGPEVSEKLIDIKNHNKTPIFSSFKELENKGPEDWVLYPITKIEGSDYYFGTKTN